MSPLSCYSHIDTYSNPVCQIHSRLCRIDPSICQIDRMSEVPPDEEAKQKPNREATKRCYLLLSSPLLTHTDWHNYSSVCVCTVHTAGMLDSCRSLLLLLLPGISRQTDSKRASQVGRNHLWTTTAKTAHRKKKTYQSVQFSLCSFSK